MRIILTENTRFPAGIYSGNEDPTDRKLPGFSVGPLTGKLETYRQEIQHFRQPTGTFQAANMFSNHPQPQ